MKSVVAQIGAVIIGRNEGDRLRVCVTSVAQSTDNIVYVDSGSIDGSMELAASLGAEVVALDLSKPFTAARARNAGFQRLIKIRQACELVQFIDGDCELADGWVELAACFLAQNPEVAVVYGRRRERYPDRSIYNWLCDQDWKGPTGNVRSCGGDIMIRSEAFKHIGGYRDDLIAGEEPELCVRLRAAGWRIWRLDEEMTLHDAAMTRFNQWWRRSSRTGYAFAQGAYLHGAPPERHRVWESRRALLWGAFIPLSCLLLGLVCGPWGWAAWLVYPLQVSRQVLRNQGPLRERILRAGFQVIGRFPEAWGQMRFAHDRLLGRRTGLIEYK